ncbi:hypothetical protein RPALISO_165 [Ruegeria phage RpAliso]|nr:hypothetical protein RPALISO_165 [Ruegeria phage RpAliso]
MQINVERRPDESMQEFQQRRHKAIAKVSIQSCQTLEDLKELLCSMIDGGTLPVRVPPPWERTG